MLQLLYWTFIMQTAQIVQGEDSEDWRITFVERSELEGEPSYPALSAIMCAAYAAQSQAGGLFCNEGNQCIISNKKKGPHISSNGMNDPVHCFTKFDTQKEACTSGPVPDCGVDCCAQTPYAMSWPDAREYCQSLGMDLLTRPYLETAEQCNQIFNIFQIESHYWIGAWNPGLTLNTIEWIDGTPLPQNDPRWYPGTPQGYEEYILITGDHEFDDFDASWPRFAMCGYRF